MEIADAPHAIDQESVALALPAIGFKSETGRRDCFDSRLAIETGQQVRREILAAAGSFGGR